MRERSDEGLDSRAVTHWAIARPCERCQVAVAVSAAGVITIAKRDATTTGRIGLGAYIRIVLKAHVLSIVALGPTLSV